MPIWTKHFIEFPKEHLTEWLGLTRKVIWDTYWHFKCSENDEFKFFDSVCVVGTAATWVENDDDDSGRGEVPIFAVLEDQKKLKLVAEMRFYLDFSGGDDPDAGLWLKLEDGYQEAVLKAIEAEVQEACKRFG